MGGLCFIVANIWLATAMDRYKDRTKWCLLIAIIYAFFGIGFYLTS